MRVTALIVAAGSGARMGGGLPKQFRTLAGKPVLAHAVDALASHPRIDGVRVVVAPDQLERARATLGERDVGVLIAGGATRTESVRNGLAQLDDGIILVHDAARPFCPAIVVDRLIDALDVNDGAVPVLAVTDTLARGGAKLGDPVDREGIFRVQTPQAFPLTTLTDSYRRWPGGVPTDEATVVRAAGGSVAAVEGDVRLEKLTSSADWARAEAMLQARLVSRTGHGIDVHAFHGDGPVVLGGLQIAHPRGLAGHSDADVVLHAITDALLGAAALGDIGQHFPPSDPQWKGANSEVFLAHAARLVRDQGGIIDFIDCTVICEEPKVGPHREAIRANVARILSLSPRAVSVKATTTERLGFAGRREGIVAMASATIRMESAE